MTEPLAAQEAEWPYGLGAAIVRLERAVRDRDDDRWPTVSPDDLWTLIQAARPASADIALRALGGLFDRCAAERDALEDRVTRLEEERDWLQAELGIYMRTASTHYERVAELEGLLREVEWADEQPECGDYQAHDRCPLCKGWSDQGHAADCRLAVAIGTAP